MIPTRQELTGAAESRIDLANEMFCPFCVLCVLCG
jgi:hypothetical protein